jgi:hypothetical protein
MISNDLQNRIHFGDREAFLAVYHEYGPGAYAAAKRALVSDSLAKSVVKQAFLTLYEEILTQTEDFDIPVRIRELTEQEINLLKLVSGEGDLADRIETATNRADVAPEFFSARGAFAEQAASLPSLPSLERERSFRRPRKGLFMPKKKKHVSMSAQVAPIWKILLVLVDLFLLWILAGMLMGLGYLPAIDLGYSWFGRMLYSLTQTFA